MTLSIELDAASFAELNRQAADLGIRADELAGRIINERIQTNRVASDDEFRKAMNATFEKNDELLRRLAK